MIDPSANHPILNASMLRGADDKHRKPRPWFKLAMMSWAAWLLILLGALGLEQLTGGVFDSKAAVAIYVALQGIAHAAALVGAVMTLVRGPTRHRLIVIVPLLILLGYAVVFISGP